MKSLKDIFNIKKEPFILDDYNFYYISYSTKNEEIIDIIEYKDIMDLLRKGTTYIYVSTEGMYRALDFERNLYYESLEKSNRKKYKFLFKEMKSLKPTKTIEFTDNKKIKEEDLDISVNIRWEGFPYSYSKDKIKVHNVNLKHKPTGLTYNADSNTGFDTGYKYALEKLEKLYNAYLYYNNHDDIKAN